MFDILKGLHAVDMMVNSWITLRTSRTAKLNIRATWEAETTRSPVICCWWWQWELWTLFCLWISGVGQATSESCWGLKVFLLNIGKYGQPIRDFAYDFPEGNKPSWEVTLFVVVLYLYLLTPKHFAMSTECICKYKPLLSFRFSFPVSCSYVQADVRLACTDKLIALRQQF